jgi:hypothetical protein
MAKSNKKSGKDEEKIVLSDSSRKTKKDEEKTDKNKLKGKDWKTMSNKEKDDLLLILLRKFDMIDKNGIVL